MSSTKQDSYIAIIDCNNFYASCERVFNPKLNNKPVVGGLFDPRMGVLEPGLICPTDGYSYVAGEPKESFYFFIKLFSVRRYF